MAWIFTMKVVLLSSCVVLMGLAMSVSVPMALEFMASHVPLVWSSVISWMRPPYLYVVINGIIISIAAFSRFHHHHDHKSSEDIDHHHHHHHHHHHVGYDDDDDQEVNKVISSEFRVMDDDQRVAVYQQREEEEEEELTDVVDDDQVKTGVPYVEVKDRDNHDGEDELVMDSRIVDQYSEEELEKKIILLSEEKPLVSRLSPKFGNRKPVKPSPEAGGKALKVVSKPKRHETMENTWKAIMEGRSMSLTGRNVKMWEWDSNLENQGRPIIAFGDLEVDQAPSTAPEMQKSQTFKDRTNQQSPAVWTTSSNLRKEPSLSQDELNKRVEAFINKFNEQMRLQRQESLNRYMEMINRGSH